MSAEHPSSKDVDDLLGLDPDPRLSPEAREAIRQGLAATARSEVKLDRLLDLDVVEVPAGLAESVLAGVRREASADRSLREKNAARRHPLRRLALPAGVLAAAAALALAVIPRGGDEPASEQAGAASSEVAATVNDAWLENPSDELLAALPVLEAMDLWAEDLEPLEEEVLFVFDADEDLMLELLEGGVDGDVDGATSGEKKKG